MPAVRLPVWRVLGVPRTGRPNSEEKDVEIAVLRHQLGAAPPTCHRASPGLPTAYNSSDRLVLATLAQLVSRERWGVFLVTPATLLRWHRDRPAPLDLPARCTASRAARRDRRVGPEVRFLRFRVQGRPFIGTERGCGTSFSLRNSVLSSGTSRSSVATRAGIRSAGDRSATECRVACSAGRSSDARDPERTPSTRWSSDSPARDRQALH